VENPTDAIALRFMNDCLFYLGRAREIKDVNLAVLPEWKKKGNYYHCYFRFSEPFIRVIKSTVHCTATSSA